MLGHDFCHRYKLAAARWSKVQSPIPSRMVVIATLAIGPDFCRALGACLESKRAYAAKHGYRYVQGGEKVWDRTRPIPWSKIPFLLGILEGLEEGEIVWLSDADVLITNSELSLESHVLPLFPENKDMLMCFDACKNLNSGNVFLRNTDWTRSFWRRMGEQTDLLYHIWWENAALIKLLGKERESVARVEIIRDHTRFNSYLQGVPGQQLWMPGHFLVHFAGVYDTERMQLLVGHILAGKIPRLSMTDNKKIEFHTIDVRP